MNDSPENPEEDFATLFEASVKTKRLASGQAVDGMIVAFGPDVAFVDIGAKGEATLSLDELRNDEGVVEAKVGDRIQATIVSTTGGLTLSRKLQRGAASRQQLEQAFRSGLAVEGRVESQVKGGYTVKVAGQRAFCPQSQIDTIRDAAPAVHLGRTYTFRIIELKDDGRTLVVSRRVLLEAEQRVKADAIRQTLTVGAVVTGRVVSVREFGAFIELGGGIQGLLHVSEMGWSRATKPEDVVKPGDEITVKILRVDSKDGGDKIALGLKQLGDDPWSQVSDGMPDSTPAAAAAKPAIAPGARLTGTVERHEKFGIFVALTAGVTGLLPFAETGVPKGADMKKAFPVGSNLDLIVLEVDPARRRIRLSVKAIEDAQERAEVRDYAAREHAAEQSSGFGSLADKFRGALKKS